MDGDYPLRSPISQLWRTVKIPCISYYYINGTFSNLTIVGEYLRKCTLTAQNIPFDSLPYSLVKYDRLKDI